MSTGIQDYCNTGFTAVREPLNSDEAKYGQTDNLVFKCIPDWCFDSIHLTEIRDTRLPTVTGFNWRIRTSNAEFDYPYIVFDNDDNGHIDLWMEDIFGASLHSLQDNETPVDCGIYKWNWDESKCKNNLRNKFAMDLIGYNTRYRISVSDPTIEYN